MKLFRKFRQNFIDQGKLRKYLLYAVGEILLVMIGILLAFQVDKWNIDRTKRQAELAYYESIKNQIEDDQYQLKGQINYNARYLAQFNYAIEIIENDDKTKLDTLGKIARNLTNYSDFDKQGNIYETMVNSGQIKLLSNEKIIEGVRNLEQRYMYINRMENIHYDAMITYVIPSINGAVKFSTGEVKAPDDLYSFKFQNLILALVRIMEEKHQIYHSTTEEIGSVIALIDEELGVPAEN